jgi:hypothetical protein
MAYDKQRPSRQGRRPQRPAKRSGLELMRSKVALGAVAATIVLGFVAAIVAFNDPTDPDAEASDTPSASPVVTPTATLPPEQIAQIEGPSTCADEAQLGTVVEGFDQVSDIDLVDGSAQITEATRNPQETGISIDIGQSRDPAVARATFDDPIDVRGEPLRLWIKQNGNIVVTQQRAWTVRLTSGPASYFERTFSRETASAAIMWCQDVSRIRDWVAFGDADASALTSIEVTVPGWPGAGVGNHASFDAFSIG